MADEGIKINLSSDEKRYEKDCEELPECDYVKYGPDWDMICSREEYIRLHDYIKAIKDKYFKGDLSPIEKLMIAFDIVKRKPYNRSGDNSLDGLPHNVAFGEHTNCRGYCNLMKEILAGEGIELVNQNLDVFDKDGNFVDYHARLTIVLDDNKYGIHGLYTVSPTEDSYKEIFKTSLSPDIKPTDLYCWFLRPFTDSDLYHSDDLEYRLNYLLPDNDINLSDNNCFSTCDENQLSYLINNYDLDELSIMNDIAFYNILNKIPQDKLSNYVNADYIDFEYLMEIISNVRLIEGFSEKQVKEDVARIRSINEPFYPSNDKGMSKDNGKRTI